MIQDKQKVEKIYNYLSALATAHESQSHKYRGWSQYDEYNKKRCFSVQEYNWDNDNLYKFYLKDVNFNYDNFWFGEVNIERIDIVITIDMDFSKLEIKKCKLEEDSDLLRFFRRLDNALEEYQGAESILTEILLSKIKGE